MRMVLEDELFEEQECPLMWHLLSYLDHRLPCVLRCKLGAVRTLAVLYDIFDLEHLLDDRRGKYLVHGAHYYAYYGEFGASSPPFGWLA